MSIEELVKAAERELAMRRRVFPSWVAKGTMRQAKADHEIAAMQEIAENLRRQLPQQNLL